MEKPRYLCFSDNSKSLVIFGTLSAFFSYESSVYRLSSFERVRIDPRVSFSSFWKWAVLPQALKKWVTLPYMPIKMDSLQRQQNRIMKKRSEATQTLCAGCSKAEPKNFAPPQTPFPGARDGQNLISCRRSLPSHTDPVWWRSMRAISSYRGNRPTNKTHKQTQTDRGDYNTLHM